VRVRPLLTAVAGMIIVHFAAATALVVSVLAAFQARRFVTDVVIRRSCDLLLWVAGVEVVVVGEAPWQRLTTEERRRAPQTVYVFNHTSSLDLFIVCALRLPRVRFFMKRRFLLFPPMGLLAWLAGTFFTQPQTQPTARTRLFQRATRTLQQTGESVFLSPEGTRVTTGEIGPFNKGAFHLAAALRAPIVPLFFSIPPQADPGKSLLVGKGKVAVHVLPTIDTSAWDIEDIGHHKDEVHALFTATHARLRAEAAAFAQAQAQEVTNEGSRQEAARAIS
jgi:putative phosphoserine phosphatase / 1-acylglycerol-3-phosphate O-acyltransferase